METEFGGLFLEVGDAAGWSGQGLFEEEQRTWQSSTKSLSSRKGMNTLIDIPTSARLHNNDIIANKGTGQLLTPPAISSLVEFKPVTAGASTLTLQDIGKVQIKGQTKFR